jgi:transposase
MEQFEINCVETQGIGFAPILRYYFERCRIGKIIDEHVWCDPRRKKLTHGQACIGMITGIFYQVMQLYHLCKLAEDNTILEVILPGIEAKEYFDDRLADTLDALVSYGLENLEMLITRWMIEEFKIENDIAHNDTTSASVYGRYEQCDSGGIHITYGFSKKHRQDLKQLVWSLSVSSDHAFPLFQQAYSGNTADVDTYVEQWLNLIDLLDRKDFLFVGDSKLIVKENMVHIHDNDGFFLAPAPMYETYKEAFNEALDKHTQELLIAYKDKLSRGFEVPFTISHNDKTYTFRMIIIYDHGLFARKRYTINNRIEKTKAAFEELEKKLNKYNLKTQEGIDKACCSILQKYHTTELFEYEMTNNPKVTYKNKKKGRCKKGQKPRKVKVVKDCYSVKLTFKDKAYQEQLYKCGYYPLITNMPKETFTIEDAMLNHKNQYKSEHTNRRAKGQYQLEPIYLHKPERIEAYLFLFKIALQLLVLIERTARKNIAKRDKGLDNFRPNRKDVRNPKSEYLLKEFQYVVSGKILLQNGDIRYFVSEPKGLQKEILEILEVPSLCFTYDYLFGGLQIPDS